MITVELATSSESFDIVRELLQEYQQELGVDLCFQNFAAELASLPGDYAPPKGCLLVAQLDYRIVGCGALRPICETICEMKRLYVRANFRKLGIGKLIVHQLLNTARAIGYEKMRLDTLPTMTSAQRLYERIGFDDTQAYRENPIPGARFLELLL